MWMGTGSIDIRDNDSRDWHDALSFGFWTGQVGNCIAVAVLSRGFISPTALAIDCFFSFFLSEASLIEHVGGTSG